jgi:hypothetical protein
VDETTALRIKDEVVNAGFQAVRAGMAGADKPDRLYHFTEGAGLIGILTSRCLWASLATGVNDNLVGPVFKNAQIQFPTFATH